MGIKVQECWAVELPDHEWFGIAEDAREVLVTSHREEALKEGCINLSIFAIPDPLFPVYGIDRKKKVHNESLETDKAFELSCTHHAHLMPHNWAKMDEKAQAKTLKMIRDVLGIKGMTNPGRYEILLPNGDGTNTVIGRGRV